MAFLQHTIRAPFMVKATKKLSISTGQTLDFGGSTVMIMNTGASTVYYCDGKTLATMDGYELRAGAEMGPVTGKLSVITTGSTLKILTIDYV